MPYQSTNANDGKLLKSFEHLSSGGRENSLGAAGRVVCAGIHLSDIPSFPYRVQWEEGQSLSIANLTRHDGRDFLGTAPQMGIVTRPIRYPLWQANEALADWRAGRVEGAAVPFHDRHHDDAGTQTSVRIRRAALRPSP